MYLAQEGRHTVVVQLGIGGLEVGIVWSGVLHVIDMMVGHAHGVGILHDASVERVVGIHISEALKRGVAQVGTGEVILQSRHHAVDVFLFGEFQRAQSVQIVPDLLHAIHLRHDAGLAHLFYIYKERVGTMVHPEAVCPEQGHALTIVFANTAVNGKSPRIFVHDMGEMLADYLWINGERRRFHRGKRIERQVLIRIVISLFMARRKDHGQREETYGNESTHYLLTVMRRAVFPTFTM